MSDLTTIPTFLQGDGEIAQSLQALDWATHPLGPPQDWPDALKTTVHLLLHSPQGMFIWWGDDLIHFYNDAYIPLVGEKHPNCLLQPASEVWREVWDDVAPMVDEIRTTEQGRKEEDRLFILNRYGYPEETYYSYSHTPIIDSSETIRGILGIAKDATKRVVMNRRHKLIQEIFDCTKGAMTREEVCVDVRNALQTNTLDIPFGLLYGIDAEDTGKLILKQTVAIDPAHPTALPEARFSESSVWPFDKVGDGSEIIIEEVDDSSFPTGDWNTPPTQVALIPLGGTGTKEICGVLVAALNPLRPYDEDYASFLEMLRGAVSSAIFRARAFEDEALRNQELKEGDRRKDEFLASLAHELRNPLAPIRSGLEVLKLAKDDPARTEETMAMMVRQTEQMVRLIDDLLDVSRITRGKVNVRLEELDLIIELRNAVDASMPFIKAANHHFELKLPDDQEKVMIFGDPHRLTQIFSNLLNNAAKYTPKGNGKISLEVTTEKDHAVVTVRDNGYGIPPDRQEQIFSMFEQFMHRGNDVSNGLGIGLTLVRSLVEIHQGTISVESEGTDKGSTFTVRFPLLSQSPEQRSLRASEPPATVQAKLSFEPPRDRKILIADDNETATFAMQMIFEMEGYEVEVASDGVEAVEAAHNFHPNIVLMDIGMPNMDGHEAARRIRAMEGGDEIHLVAISGWGRESDMQKSDEAGFDRHLVKPVNPDQLRELLHSLPARRSSEQSASSRP
ncbi:MAG: hypothetical protein CMO55_28940 [Verrucomicrobiales bacterium]|nr:hypothetical protein [Verrucomicrobiales bacterium]